MLSTILIAQVKEQNFEAIEQAINDNPKHIVVFIHTDWCAYCKNMENTTFKNSKIVEKLNTDFYFVSLNAEARETIHFRNREFKFIPNGKKTGVHQLALELAMIDSKISYPTLTVLNEKYEIVFQHSSFLTHKQLDRILNKLNNS